MSVRQIARELGIGRTAARKLAEKYPAFSKPAGTPPTYDPRFIAWWQKTHGRPTRVLQPRESDWLTQYTKEGLHDAAPRNSTTGPQAPGHRR